MPAQLDKPFDRHREVCTSFGRGERMDLVDDHRVNVGQGARRRRGQHEVQRLGRGDQNVGRVSLQASSFGLIGVARAHTDRWDAHRHPEAFRLVSDSVQRRTQIPFNVNSQGAQWRDVDDPGAGTTTVGGVGEWCVDETIDSNEECSEGLAGTCRGRHQRVGTADDQWPRRFLRGSRCAEC